LSPSARSCRPGSARPGLRRPPPARRLRWFRGRRPRCLRRDLGAGARVWRSRPCPWRRRPTRGPPSASAAPTPSQLPKGGPGVDQKDYQQALAQYDPNGVVNPGDSNQARQFEQGVSTSDDTDVQLLEIQPVDQSSPVKSADVTFQSSQSPGSGPTDNPDETCT